MKSLTNVVKKIIDYIKDLNLVLTVSHVLSFILFLNYYFKQVKIQLMKKIKLVAASVFFIFILSLNASAQEVTKKNGYTLTFESNYAALNPALRQRLIETFFEVYPKLAKEYNANANKEVKFFVDTAYKGVAATGNGRVVFSWLWMQKHPEDIDVVTHEVMQIVQNYGNSKGPGWLTEGLADYVRYKYGVDNAGSKGALPDYKAGQSYRNSYRITTRFLNWLENNGHAGIVKKLDAQLRDHTYTEQNWKDLTGKTSDELWADYEKS